MADTQRTLSALVALLATNTTKSVTAQHVRDFLVSANLQRVRTIDTSGPVTTDDRTVLIDNSGDNVVISLPAASAASAHTFVFKRISAGANDCTIDCAGADEIDGAGDYDLLSQYDSITIQSDGTHWHIIGAA